MVPFDFRFQSYLNELAQQKERIITQNNSMAEYNLSKEPELTEGRDQLASLYEEVERLTKVVEEKQAELSRFCSLVM